MPNLICVLKMWLNCCNTIDIEDFKKIPILNNQSEKECECERREFIDNSSFCNWLFKQKYYVAIAHNLKGYGGVFVMNYILNKLLPKDPQPLVISNGSKLFKIEWKSVKLIDSYSFIPIVLAKFPKTFGLKEYKKGFFPHLFNTAENQNYRGVYPDRYFYG